MLNIFFWPHHMACRLLRKSVTRNQTCAPAVEMWQRSQRSNCQHLLEKAREFQKNIYFCFIDYTKTFDWITTNWKILQEMGIPDHLTRLLRNLYAGQEATVRTGHGTWKGVCQGCVLSPCLFNLHVEYIV